MTPPRLLKSTVLTLVALLAAQLAGCASMAPDYQVPASYPADAQPTAGERAAALDWRAYFADPQPQALIAQALEHNRDLRLALVWPQFLALFVIGSVLFALSLPPFRKTIGQME